MTNVFRGENTPEDDRKAQELAESLNRQYDYSKARAEEKRKNGTGAYEKDHMLYGNNK